MVLEEKPVAYMTIEDRKAHLTKIPDNETPGDPFKKGCPYCKADRVKIVRDYDNGETCCGECGSVLYSEIDMGPEWRAYSLQEKSQRSRVGAPSNPLLHDKGLGTAIPQRNVDFYGRKLSQQSIQNMNRLRKWNVRCRVNETIDRSIIYNNYEIEFTCNGLEGRIPKITQQAAVSIMTKVSKGKMVDGERKSLIRGRSRKALSKASTVIAARNSGLAVTLNDMADADKSVSRKDLARAYRDLVNSGVRSAAQTYEPLIKRYINSLWTADEENPGLPSAIELIAVKMLKGASSNVREDGERCSPYISGKGPSGTAAAIVYMSGLMSGKRQTQKDIAEIAKVTEVTVRNRYKDILDRLMIECSI